MDTLKSIKELVKRNDLFRKVVLTGKKSQLVLMSLRPGEDIGEETHAEIDQMFFIEEGKAELIMDGKPITLDEHDVALVPAGVRHNLLNPGKKPIKLFTIYSPPAHAAGEIQKMKPEFAVKKY
jgi:mannose-6-phosphate isomerase-like protein (cupin superfamily)